VTPGSVAGARATLLIVTAVDAERDAVAEALEAGERVLVGPYEALRGPGATILAGAWAAAAAAAAATALSLAPATTHLP